MPALSVIPPARRHMSQLDFREALSTPGQTVLNGHELIAAFGAEFPFANSRELPSGVSGFSRSTWANVAFVTLASLGAVFCAFYFFNGAEVLRAAAAWPEEFLYPRPAGSDAEQPNPVDHFNRTTFASPKSKNTPFDRNYFPSFLSQPGTNLGAFSPGAFDVSNPGAPPFSSVTSAITQLNLLPPGADSIFQSLYQRAMSLTPERVKGIVTNTVRSTRHKTSTAQQRVTNDLRNLTNRTASAISTANINNAVARSTVQNTQQISNQTSIVQNTQQITNQTSANVNTSLNSVRSQSQMLMSTSHGTGLGNGLGSGVGSALNGIGSGVRGLGGGRH